MLILFAIAGFLKGFSDHLLFKITPESRVYLHPFFDPDVSWRNKWKNGNPEEGPRFLGSSTIFVGFTDAWHLAELLQYGCLQAMFAMAASNGFTGFNPIVEFLSMYFLAWIVRSVSFSIPYS